METLARNRLAYFSIILHFYISWKRQKIFSFFTFSGRIEMEHRAKIAQYYSRRCFS